MALVYGGLIILCLYGGSEASGFFGMSENRSIEVTSASRASTYKSTAPLGSFSTIYSPCLSRRSLSVLDATKPQRYSLRAALVADFRAPNRLQKRRGPSEKKGNDPEFAPVANAPVVRGSEAVVKQFTDRARSMIPVLVNGSSAGAIAG